MKILDELERLSKEATPGPWGVQPGCGHDEDEGCMFVSAVGPSYSFLIGDEWEYAPDPIPMGILKETEAQRRAVADQSFIRAARQHIEALIQVARAAEEFVDIWRDPDFSKEGTAMSRSKLLRALNKLEKLK